MPQRILIVEDERSTRRALVAVFAKLGLIPLEAASVEEALERLSRETDIIFLDLMLENRTGVEVLRYVRQEKLIAKVAVISAADEPDVLAQVTSLHPDAIFGKPLDLPDCLHWLRSLGVSTAKAPRAILRQVAHGV